jgi:hypothetical protein
MSKSESTCTTGWSPFLVQTPALVIAVLALAFSLGGAAYASTQLGSTRDSSTNSNPFQPLTLVNGWVSEAGVYNTGMPGVSVSGGVVYLRGSLAQPTPGSAVFATLPVGDRPAHNLYITVYTNNDTSGTLYIERDGTMEAYSSSVCSGTINSAQCFTSLASVSFPTTS